MLVALRMVYLVEAGQVNYSANALDEMREQFLLYRIQALFS